MPLHPIVDDALRDWSRRGPLWAARCTHVTARTNAFLHSLSIESTLHTARHWFGTNVLETSGGNVRVAQECLSHESIASTMVYTQITSAARSSAVELLRVGLAARYVSPRETTRDLCGHCIGSPGVFA